MVHQEFVCWRQGIDKQASECRSVEVNEARSHEPRDLKQMLGTLLASEPEFGSPGWWSCMISEKIRNYEAGMRKHGTDISAQPSGLDDLPPFHETAGAHATEKTQYDDMQRPESNRRM